MSKQSQKTVLLAEAEHSILKFFIKKNKCIFPPETLCSQDGISGCSWGGETGDHVDQCLYIFCRKEWLISYISGLLPNIPITKYFCFYHPVALNKSELSLHFATTQTFFVSAGTLGKLRGINKSCKYILHLKCIQTPCRDSHFRLKWL